MGSCCQYIRNCFIQLQRLELNHCHVCILAPLLILTVTFVIWCVCCLCAYLATRHTYYRDRTISLLYMAAGTAGGFALVLIVILCHNTSVSRVPGNVSVPMVGFTSEELPNVRTDYMPRPRRISYPYRSDDNDNCNLSRDKNIWLTDVQMELPYLEDYTQRPPLILESGPKHKYCDVNIVELNRKRILGEPSGLGRSSCENETLSAYESTQTVQETISLDDEVSSAGKASPKRKSPGKTVVSKQHRYAKKSKLAPESDAGESSGTTKSSVHSETEMSEDSKRQLSHSAPSKKTTSDVNSGLFSTAKKPGYGSQGVSGVHLVAVHAKHAEYEGSEDKPAGEEPKHSVARNLSAGESESPAEGGPGFPLQVMERQCSLRQSKSLAQAPSFAPLASSEDSDYSEAEDKL